MPNDSNELNRWVSRVQRKLDSMPLTKLDREELEEMIAIIINLAQQQVVAAPGRESTQTSTKTTKKNGGES